MNKKSNVTKNYDFSERITSSKSSKVGLCRTLLILGAILYVGAIIILIFHPHFHCIFFKQEFKKIDPNAPTHVSHLLFGLVGSEKAVHYRKAYTESWWRPGETRGYLYLDEPPTGDLLPWSPSSPPYRVSDDLTKLFEEIKPRKPIMHRMNHAIYEIMRENRQDFRWLVMGDDDSMFFLENMVDVLAKYDHTKYYYFGGQSEFIMSNYWFSFNQGFGGGGFILSYPLAKALANDMENCLRRTADLYSADQITMACIANIGVNLTPLKGIHQVDMRGDLSGFLSSHPQAPLISLHHLDMVDPIYPKMDRFESARHLMKAAQFDQSRMLQQTVCHQRQKSLTFATTWGYSVHIYERILPRWWLQYPIETFTPWLPLEREPPHYMFNTRKPFNDPCEAPHVFSFKSIKRISANVTRTIYHRVAPRLLPSCQMNGSHAADYITKIDVDSPATKLTKMDRCECCDIHFAEGMSKVKITYRECMANEIMA